MLKTEDIFNIFKEKYANGEFRIIGNDVQQSQTIEIQNAHFEVDKPWIVREPNYSYYDRELQWYNSQSLNVYDIPGKAPKQWINCSDKDGNINSNYGWCIFSKENFDQYRNCKKKLIEDPHTREAIMIYNRPSMQYDYNKNGMHDFMCCQNVQYFINEREDKDGIKKQYLDCIANYRSSDAVFGFNNDMLWTQYVLTRLAYDLNVESGKIYFNAGSLHIYKRHFDYLLK